MKKNQKPQKNPPPDDSALINDIEMKSKEVKQEIETLNKKGDLDILSLLDIVKKRVQRARIEPIFSSPTKEATKASPKTSINPQVDKKCRVNKTAC